MLLHEKWQKAMAAVKITHIDPTCEPVITVTGDVEPLLYVIVKNCRDTTDQERRWELTVSTVKLSYWPGETVAQAWIAAAWAGYIQHEALELVKVAGIRVLDPHLEPHTYDRGLRCGFPPVLTPRTLADTLSLVMHERDVTVYLAENP